jgi:hypothetical protein
MDYSKFRILTDRPDLYREWRAWSPHERCSGITDHVRYDEGAPCRSRANPDFTYNSKPYCHWHHPPSMEERQVQSFQTRLKKLTTDLGKMKEQLKKNGKD